jgi:hypothetical protein
MRIKMDVSSVRFMVTKAAEPRIDRDTQKQRVDRTTGALLWQLQLMALDETGGEILPVTIDQDPKVPVGEFVRLADLVAMPWSQGDRSGVAFRAASITPAKSAQAA